MATKEDPVTQALRAEVENLRKLRDDLLRLGQLPVFPQPPKLPPEKKLTEEQKDRIGEVLGVRRVWQATWPWHNRLDEITVETEWPEEDGVLTAKTLLGLAQELGYSDVQVKPAGLENEDLTLIFIK